MAVCPICGETSPEPLWMCVPRLLGTSKPNERCDYSQEGEKRLAEALSAADPALPRHPPPSNGISAFSTGRGAGET